MAIRKQVLILANSIRLRDRCVAGKELVRAPDGHYEAGGWIRFADRSHPEGAVPAIRTRLADGGWAEVLDVLELEFEGSCEDPNHPEDCWIRPGAAWAATGRYNFADLRYFADAPETLWHSAEDNRYVEEGYIPTMRPPASLYLIRLDRDAAVESRQEKGSDGRTKTQMRMKLVYRGRTHELSITDPVFTEKHNLYQERQGSRGKLMVPAGSYVCTSLTREFNGRHYKIAATIIEPDA